MRLWKRGRLRLFLCALFLLGVLAVGEAHDVLHEGGDAECSLCFVGSTEAPEPVVTVRPALFDPHALTLHDQIAPSATGWTAAAPRAPPARG